ncbi:actin-interacting protein-like protein [Leishmania panamensis]|uniref:Actin-interacting protein-like protein n=1 Tax=Leishmania panamensis TaxID=5679 RepID=A0A088RS89_LEIPA|nr:actin-interacting protein-like protein [Leishmania panamensis]AIN98745.1 actin-interacting protein-like protein [Leishmania panamensis]
MRNSRSRSPTLVIAEAEAVRAACEFSIDIYRKLHQRKFKSLHEELDFLRKDFVASRKTLALLHKDNIRLEQELMSRVVDIDELRRKLEDAQREAEQQTPSQRERGCGSGSEKGDLVDCRRCGASSLWADADDMGEVRMNTASEGGKGGRQQQQPRDAEKEVSATKAPSRESALRTSLPLYAASRQRKSGTAAISGASARDLNDANPQQLICDLRANLARRDTALNEVQMELGALQHIRQRLEAEGHRLQDELSEVKKQRDALQAQLTAQEELHTATVAQAKGFEVQVQQLTKEKEDVQRRLTTAELLYEYTGSMSDGKTSGAASGIGGGYAHAQEEALREQLQLYRSKWQAAEDQMEHLHERISQLQRQLAISRADDGVTAGPLKPAASELCDAVQAVVQEAKCTADMAALRRQHHEQLQLHIEEAQRLQRRLERAQENASFHEDQLRQQRQDDARQHHSEVQALQAQLRTAQGELVKAQEDREHLARQLRRSTEQQTTVEVLRSQVEQLKQRLGEVGADLAHVRGREKQLTLQAQRERLERAKAEHDAEAAQELLEREKTEAQYLREELIITREQLGMHEATEVSGTGATPAPPSPPSTRAPDATDAGDPQHRRIARTIRGAGDAEGDAVALSSELKGYVGLMRLNTALQRRIAELEAQALTRHGSGSSEGESTSRNEGETQQAQPTVPASEELALSKTPPGDLSSPPALEQQQAAHLQEELAKALQSQHTLMATCAEAEKERRQLIEDNQTLADGLELLERQLRKYRAKRARKAIARDASSSRAEAPPSALTAGAKSRKHADVEEELPTNPCRSHDTQPRESRVRSRLQTARAQDHNVIVHQSTDGKGQQPQPQQGNERVTTEQNLSPVCTGCRSNSGRPAATVRITRSASATPFAVACGVAGTGVADCTGAVCCHSPPCTVGWVAEINQGPMLWPQSQLFLSALAPSSLPLSPSQSSPRETHGDDTVPPTPEQRTSANAAQWQKPISPPPLHPCRFVHGSILPPVYYPSLVERSRD